jgi:HSP20 family protein
MSFPSLFRVQRRELPALRVAHPAIPLVDEVNRLFDDFFRDFPTTAAAPAAFVPSLAVEETPDALRISAELPGLEEKDFELSVDDGVFTLRGEKRNEREAKDEKAGWVRSERSYGRFERRIALPAEVEVEKAAATFKNGVLEVTLPKRVEVRPKAHTITVKPG